MVGGVCIESGRLEEAMWGVRSLECFYDQVRVSLGVKHGKTTVSEDQGEKHSHWLSEETERR